MSQRQMPLTVFVEELNLQRLQLRHELGSWSQRQGDRSSTFLFLMNLINRVN
jgi:hypothetical protein